MSNFGQGFQNTGFDPSLLYQLPNAGGNINVGNLGVGGGGDQSQQNQSAAASGFNLSQLTANLGGAGGNSIPQGWLTSFNTLQSQASQQMNQQARQQQQPQQQGNQLNQVNVNQGLGGNPLVPQANDSQRQLDIVCLMS